MNTTDPNMDEDRPFADRLLAYGCTSVIRLDEKLSAPVQLDYLDLLPKQSNHAPASRQSPSIKGPRYFISWTQVAM
jgi:hypothetical protein